MKLTSLLAALAAAVLGASVAVAAPPPGKGKPPATGAGCKPKVTVVLKGTLAATPGPSGTSVSVNATSGNKFAQPYVKLAQPLSVAVDANTKIRRQGKKTLGDLLSGDRVLLQARVCKGDLAAGATPPLTARFVTARPAATT